MIEFRYRKAKDGDKGIIKVATGMNEPMELYVMQYREIIEPLWDENLPSIKSSWQDVEISDEVD